MGKTGGGPPPPALSTAEEALVQSMEGRPVLSGFSFGVDTDDDPTHPDESKIIEIEGAASSISCQNVAPSSSFNNSSIPIESTETDIEFDTKRVLSKKHDETKKRKYYSTQQEETLKNTKLDSERLVLEQKKLRLEIEKLQSDIQLNELKKSAYLSLQAMAENINSYYIQKIGNSLLGHVTTYDN